jgi:hypothetical protein
LEWLLKKLGIELAKALTYGEYKRIKEENKLAQDYGDFIHILEEVAKKRAVTCTQYELSKDCPLTTVIWDYYQDGKTSSGTAPLRLFTIVGSDGQTINVQGFDLSKTIKITVRHTNGRFDFEVVDPTEAMKWIRREAGYH